MKFFFMPPPIGVGGIKFYRCPSVRPSRNISVAHFSGTTHGNNLKFGMLLYHYELYVVSVSLMSDVNFLFGGGICVLRTYSLLSVLEVCLSYSG